MLLEGEPWPYLKGEAGADLKPKVQGSARCPTTEESKHRLEKH